MECLRVGFGLVGGNIFVLGEDFVAGVVEMEVKDLELEVGVVGRLAWGYWNVRLYFLWCLSRMSLEGKMSSVDGCPFGMVMWGEFFMKLFFLIVVVFGN